MRRFFLCSCPSFATELSPVTCSQTMNYKHVRRRSLKLQYCRTIVLLNELRFKKKHLFQKRRRSTDFPPRKVPVAQKHRAISRQEKVAFSTPGGLSWDFPPLPPESVRTGGRTLKTQPKFLGSIGYRICLPMVLREL